MLVIRSKYSNKSGVEAQGVDVLRQDIPDVAWYHRISIRAVHPPTCDRMVSIGSLAIVGLPTKNTSMLRMLEPLQHILAEP